MKISELAEQVIELKVLALEEFEGVEHFSMKVCGRVVDLYESVSVGGLLVSSTAEVKRQENGEYMLYLRSDQNS